MLPVNNNTQNGLDRLKEALRIGIALHYKLRDAIESEKKCLADSDPARLRKINEITADIEGRIERNNDIISKLFNTYYVSCPVSDGKNRSEVDSLIQMLRNSMREALKAVGDTLDSVKLARTEVVNDMRDLSKSKCVVNCYAAYR